MVKLLTEQRQHQIEEPDVLLLPRDTYANFSKAFQIGEWGCFYTIFSEFAVATKSPKTNLLSGKSQQKQEVQIQKKPVYTSFFMQHIMQDKTKYV
ncbi:TPA: hypothetical protein L9K38_004574 [Klebsiella pneumoniae]|uniref:hypothetical protein n=1 Tax=Klebsiella TaxID=570 RepID=UPI0015C62E5A|nr:hypothetical protein [Klebsiella pneumoniae]EIW3890102.1 hypothetical protein [Klebsiella pneumoniae]EKR8706026.1 hypothetical protein [Klebsiella pneumoniae]EKU3647180.1 hypothetical protein [Klebsiella pneumoniae]ELA1011573.1 hypothetical protein [Klebsiella pneumoniae]ELA2380713.1 hypothetical protein [Klebsiella pneumoniae]